jgi:hypothetical protein
MGALTSRWQAGLGQAATVVMMAEAIARLRMMEPAIAARGARTSPCSARRDRCGSP